MGCREGLNTRFSSDDEQAGPESRAGWQGPASSAHGGRRIDVEGENICWCQTPGFIVRGETTPTTETHPQPRIYVEGNDFPIKPVLLDVNI